jgi:PKD repeat protein
VKFTDLSTNIPYSWAWTFGDGTSSTAKNPAHVYSSDGTYTVTLKATNAGGSNTATRTNYIVVSTSAHPPVADFIATPTTGNPPLSVTFTDTSSNAPTSWLWTFGDGASATIQNPTHPYTNPGTYTVTLTASNAGGNNSKMMTDYITVIEPTISLALENPFTGNWNLAQGENTQDYGNLVITSNANWQITTAATNGDYLMQGSNKLVNKLQLNNGDATVFMDTGSGNKTRGLSFSQKIDPADLAGNYNTVVTFTGVTV